MADDAQTIRSINWRDVFPFTNLFRAFRIAIHPSKLVLGFAMLFLLYGGGRVLDWIWPGNYQAINGEISLYEQYQWSHERSALFSDIADEQREQAAHDYASRLADKDIVKDKAAALADAHRGKYHDKLQSAIVRKRNDDLKTADDELTKRLKRIDDDTHHSEQERREAQRAIRDHYDQDVRGIEARMTDEIRRLDQVTPQPLFDSFFDYEVRQFHNTVDSALAWNFLGGMTVGPTEAPLAGADHPHVSSGGGGVVRCIANLVVIGPGWLLHYHFLYFILYAIWFLLVWAIFGGAIARIAAVHVARDEKISVRQALRFSASKLLSFVFAPIIPLIIILAGGFVIAVGGLLMYIPVLGPIVVGALFILALLAGFIITLVATGTVGGFNLMYPTIAVEGSDSFDAISRSFSYLFARPWRMIFYTLVSLVYGGLCFLFARYFVYVMLQLTHFFAQWLLYGKPGHYWPEIWPPVSDADLSYRINYQALAWSECIGAVLIAMWVYIVISFLAAFVISFYFSANTIIYFLMRREVDATELDDVYVEETEEDFGEPAVVAPSPVTPAITPTAAPAETPASPPPAEGGAAGAPA